MKSRLSITAIIFTCVFSIVSSADAAFPVADISPTSITVNVGETVTFDASGSYDIYGSIVEYEWILPEEAYYVSDDGTDTLTCKFTPASAGTYTVSVIVKDNDGYWSATSADCTVTVNSAGPYWYVSTNGDNDNDGQSWQTAFGTIQLAIDSAVDGDVIYVDAGEYFENIDFGGKDLTLTNADPNDSGITASTIIAGNGFRPTVSFKGSETSDALLSGVTVTTVSNPNSFTDPNTLLLVDPNLVAYWKLDGVPYDYIGYHNGQLISAPTWGSGVDGNSITLNGADQYIDVSGYKGISGSRSRTCSAWVKTTDDKGAIIGWGTEDTAARWLTCINFSSTQGTEGAFRIMIDGGYQIGTTVINDGLWHHVAAVVEEDSTDISQAKIYVDGMLDTISGSYPCQINTGCDSNVKIGYYDAGNLSDYFEGSIDDVCIYDRALNSYEIEELYKSRSGGVISRWRFDNNAKDSFGVNDGTLYGDPNWALGVDGSAIVLNGIDQYMEVDSNPSLKPELPITLCTWVYLNEAGQRAIFIETDEWDIIGCYGAYLRLTALGYGTIALGYGDGGSNASASSRRTKIGTTVLEVGRWYHVAGVIRGPQDMSIYINGVDDGGEYSGTGDSIAYTAGEPAHIGHSVSDETYLDGMLDDMRVYDRALSDLEIRHLYCKAGGGISGNGTKAAISRCIVKDNKAEYGGGMAGIDGLIDRCAVMNNTAIDGGGIAGCNGLIGNSIIADNEADCYGGGMVDCNDIVNCTIVNNGAASGSGLSYCNGLIANSIIWGNDLNQIGSSSDPNYCCIQNWTGGGTGNIYGNPYFLDPNSISGADGILGTSDDGLCLLESSPCIDAGTDTSIAFDITGGQRPVDYPAIDNNGGTSVYDIGAYEMFDIYAPFFDGSAWVVLPTADSNSVVTMQAAAATDVSGYEYYFKCIENPAYDSGWQDSSAYTLSGMAGGRYTFQIQLRDKSSRQNLSTLSYGTSVFVGDVEFIISDAGDGRLNITYTTYNNVKLRSVALEVSLSGNGCIVPAPDWSDIVIEKDNAYNCFLDYAVVHGASNMSYGHPLAAYNVAGEPSSGTSQFAISMAKIDFISDSGVEASDSTLVTLQLTGTQGSSTVVTVDVDNFRGGSLQNCVTNLPVTNTLMFP
jgi:hypothetical protein